MSTIGELERWMSAREDEHLELKEAKQHDDCIALANEGGGKLVLGVRDGMPRRVVGTSAFVLLSEVKGRPLDKAKLRVDAEERKRWLRELKDEERVHVSGMTRSARWLA
jgi:ATP-dependent DNA helicase RecG